MATPMDTADLAPYAIRELEDAVVTRWLRETKCGVYLEIGTFRGGSLWHFGQHFKAAFGVDLALADEHREAAMAAVRRLRDKGCESDIVWGSSWLHKTQEEAKALLDELT